MSTTTNPKYPLQWEEEHDEHDNSYWEADAQSHPDDCFAYRVRQRLRANKIEWYEDGSPELMFNELEPRVWDSADEAKHDIQADHDAAVRESKKTHP